MSEGLDFSALERAIAAVISRATGLPAEDTSTGAVAKVIPVNQQLPAPPPPYITFKVPPDWPTGPAEIRKTFDAKRPAGEDIKVTARTVGEFTLGVSAYSLGTHGSKDFEGTPTAQKLIRDFTKKIRLPTYRDQLQCAGLVVIDILRPVDFSARLGPAGQGRCSVEIRMRVVDSVSEYESYITEAPVSVTTT